MFTKRLTALTLLLCSVSVSIPSARGEEYAPPPMFGDTDVSAPIAAPAPDAPKPAAPPAENLLGFEDQNTAPTIDPRPPVALPEDERSQPVLEKPEAVPAPQKQTAQKSPELKPVPPVDDFYSAAPSENTAAKSPPLPGTKPYIKQAEKPKRALVQAKKVKQSGPKMPAVPPRPVEAEILPPPGGLPTTPEKIVLPPPADTATKLQDEALAEKIVTPSAEALLDEIESVPATQNADRQFINRKALEAPAPDDVLAALPAPKPENKEEKDPGISEKVVLDKITLAFKSNLSDVSDDVNGILSADVLPKLQANPKLRVQLQAYASASAEDGQSAARRISLSRALAVRTWLMDKGIDAARMDVRALGMNTNQTPPDRVDLVFSE